MASMIKAEIQGQEPMPDAQGHIMGTNIVAPSIAQPPITQAPMIQPPPVVQSQQSQQMAVQQSGVQLSDGSYVSQSDYDALSPTDQASLKQLGVAGFNAQQTAN